MIITGNKGIALSIDAVFAVMLMLIIFGIIMNISNQHIWSKVNVIEERKLERSALSITDLIMKTSDNNSIFLGSAIVLKNEKRVLENNLDYYLLKEKQFRRLNLAGNVKIAEIYIQYFNGSREIIFEGIGDGKCVVIERFSVIHKLLDSLKAKLGVVVCNAQ